MEWIANELYGTGPAMALVACIMQSGVLTAEDSAPESVSLDRKPVTLGVLTHQELQLLVLPCLGCGAYRCVAVVLS